MHLAFVHLAFGDAVIINYILHFTLFLQQAEGNLIGAIPNSVYNLSLTALELCLSAEEHSKKLSYQLLQFSLLS